MKRFLLTGHVDHGKSTLCGRLLVNYGSTDAHEVEKRKLESPNNWLGQLLDTFEEERSRNKTFEWSRTEIGPNIELFDTPGHKMFIREFLQALTAADISCGILCVSSKSDEFHSGFRLGEVKEYLKLIRSTGIKDLIVVWTKVGSGMPASNDEDDLKKYLRAVGFSASVFHVDSFEDKGVSELWAAMNSVLPAVPSSVEVSEGDVIRGELRFFVEELFTAGYTGVCHSFGEEAMFEFAKFRLPSKAIVTFVHASKTPKVEVVLKLSRPIRFRDRLILRNTNNETIGYVIVSKKMA
eukprot:ANDGO_01625.mRNA.1 Eukaryotic peptide chain release factor GTP-binding subunit